MNNLIEEAQKCLLIADPEEKIAYSLDVVAAWENGRLAIPDEGIEIIVNEVGRLEKPQLVAAEKVGKRGFGSEKQRASLLHALAHIELTAINLSWDSICRYPNMPREYYDDWVNTANDESYHFLALKKRLQVLGFDYGDFRAHNELWGMAVKTGAKLMHRMGIVHRVLEARALDVVPVSVKRFDAIKDLDTAKVLITIANDEVNHVGAGTRWFRYCCQQENVDPDKTFFSLIRQYMKGYPKGPFNIEARKKAGFSQHEIDLLNRYDQEYRENRLKKQTN